MQTVHDDDRSHSQKFLETRDNESTLRKSAMFCAVQSGFTTKTPPERAAVEFARFVVNIRMIRLNLVTMDSLFNPLRCCYMFLGIIGA